MRDLQTYIVSVESKPVQSTGGTRYVVNLADGSKPSTFDGAVANKAGLLSQVAAQAQGVQPPLVTVRLEDVPNAKNPARPYTNILEVAGPGESLGAAPVQMPALPAIPGAPVAVQQPGFVTPAPAPAAQQGGGSLTIEDKLRITRLSAASTAGTIVAGLFEGAGDVDNGVLFGKVIALSEALAQYAFTGTGPGQQVIAPATPPPAPEAPIVPVATSPQEVAATMPAGMVTVGAPPVAAPAAAAPVAAPETAQSTTLPAWLGGQG